MSDNVIKHLATGTEALLEHMLPFMDDTLAKERLNTIVSSSDTTALRCFGIIYRTPVVVSDLFDQGFYRKFAVMDFARRIQKLLLELGDLFESMWASPMALPLAFIGGDRAMYLAYIRASGISAHAANARFGTTIPCMDKGALPHLTLDLTSVNGMALLEPVWSK